MFAPALGHMNLEGMKGRIRSAYLLADYSEVIVTPFWNADNGVSRMDSENDVYLAFGNPPQSTFPLPDPDGTVICIEYT